MDTEESIDLTNKPKPKRRRGEAELLDSKQADGSEKKAKTRAQHRVRGTQNLSSDQADETLATSLSGPLNLPHTSSSSISDMPDQNAVSSSTMRPANKRKERKGGKGRKQQNHEAGHQDELHSQRELEGEVKQRESHENTQHITDQKEHTQQQEKETTQKSSEQNEHEEQQELKDEKKESARVTEENNKESERVTEENPAPSSSSTSSPSQPSSDTTRQLGETTSRASSFDEEKARDTAQNEVLAWSAGTLKSHVLAALRGNYLSQHTHGEFQNKKSEERTKEETARLRSEIQTAAHAESQRLYAEMEEKKGEQYNLIVKRVQASAVDKIVNAKRADFAMQSDKKGVPGAEAAAGARLTKIMEELKKHAKATIKANPGKKSVDASIFLHCAGMVFDCGISKGKDLGRDSRVRAAFLDLCRGKPPPTVESATPTVVTQSDEALMEGDKSMKEHYVRDALKRKMQLSAHTFSWNPKDWDISGWPADVRPLMDPKHYRVPELLSLYASLSRITFVSARLPKSAGFDVVLSAQRALSSITDSCDLHLSRIPASDGSSSMSSSSQPNIRDKLSLDSSRLKLISEFLPSLMEMPLAELQSKLSPFSNSSSF